MKKSFLFLFIALAQAVPVLSQSDGFDGFSNLQSASTSMFRSFDNRYEGVKGYPTLFENFSAGRVVTKNGSKYNNVQINLDIYMNELIVFNTRLKKSVIVNSVEIDSFMIINPIDKTPLQFKKIMIQNKSVYAQLLADGKVRLFRLHTKKLEKANYTGGYNQNGKRHDEFIEEPAYYVQTEANEFVKINQSKRSILKALPGMENEIDSWAEKNGFNAKSDEDLKRLFNYLNSK